MKRNNELLKFILKKKIPLRLAIEILEEAESEKKENWKAKEKAVLGKYETR